MCHNVTLTFSYAQPRGAESDVMIQGVRPSQAIIPQQPIAALGYPHLPSLPPTTLLLPTSHALGMIQGTVPTRRTPSG